MLELKGICYSAEDESRETEILKDINVTIDDRFIAVTGPNGSGKSTLARIVAGILKPTAGQILLDGADITDLSITERANMGISFAFQQPVRFKGITVRELLSIAAGKDATMAEICGMLSEVGLCARDYVNREVNASLSGGELKRIEIAMIMARRTKVSIFDEPEAGIDLWSFQNLIHVFEKMHEEIHGSILIISHQERILNIADRIILLTDGQIKKVGSKEEIMPELLGAGAPCKTLTDKL
jgi:Fe-S cluster assembly ATP-binding protein